MEKLPATLPKLAALSAPVVLWAMVWGGMQAGEIRLLLEWEGLNLFLNRLRATIPIWAGIIAVIAIYSNLRRHQRPGFKLAGPLGFIIIYGLVGALAAVFSPNAPLSLFWSGVYISVPVVLIAIIWGPGGTQRIHRLMRFNTLVILALVILLFFVALTQLNLAPQLMDKSTWLNCSLDAPWFGLDFGPVDFLPLGDGLLRPTGVGRFSGLVAIIALTSLSHGSWRFNAGPFRIVWGIVLIASIILLWSSGARTAIIGFIGSVITIGILYAYFSNRPKFALGGIAATCMSLIALLPSGIPQEILKGCITSSTYTAGTSLLKIPDNHSAERESPKEIQSKEIQEPINPDRGLASPPNSTIIPSSDHPDEPSTTTQIEDEEKQEPIDRDQHVTSPPNSMQIEDEEKQEPIDRDQHVTSPPNSTIIPSSDHPDEPSTTTQIEDEEKQEPIDRDQHVTSPPNSIVVPTPNPHAQAKLGKEIQSSKESPKQVNPIEGDTGGGFFAFSGRTVVWKAAWDSMKESPLIGFGFHSDRLKLGTHMHNSYLHALYQAGLLGFLPFITALCFTWALLVKALLSIRRLPIVHKHLLIQSAGIIVFFSVRTLPESTAAFFGIDWLLLAPVMLYLQVIPKILDNSEISE